MVSKNKLILWREARAVEGTIFQHFAKNDGAIQKSLGIGHGRY
jgi:hypothetical protein